MVGNKTNLSKTIEGDCPKCGMVLKFDVKDRTKGNEVLCPECKKTFSIGEAKNPKETVGIDQKAKTKKIVLVVIGVLILLGLCCSGVSESDDTPKTEKTQRVEKVQQEEVKKETEEERIEREAREEEERLIAEQKAEEERLREEQEKAEEEERLRLLAIEEEKRVKSSALAVTYDDLLRYPENYYLKEIYIKGEIVQSLGSNQYHINMTPTRYGYTDRVWVVLYLENDVKLSLIEKDIVEIWGMGMNNQSYETALGSSNTVPYIFGYYANLVTKAGDR
jgi:flagellar biosynthesis GTPase FlhF